VPEASDDGWGPERRVASRAAAPQPPEAPPAHRTQRPAPAPAPRSTVRPPAPAPRSTVRPPAPAPRPADAARPANTSARPANTALSANTSARPVTTAQRGDVAVRDRAADPLAHDIIGNARQRARRASGPPQRGLIGWVAVALLVVISGMGGLIDAVAGSTLKGVFAIGLILGSLAAILLVRHRDMFPVVIAPPLIYFGASAVLLYFRSGGFKDRGVLIDAVSNWLVYGFPAIAGASAVVLIVAGGRLVLNK
jgi:hypothetical protein